MGESLRWEFVRELGRIFLRTAVVVLEAGFLHLELGHHIHKDHNERMQKTIARFENTKMVGCINCRSRVLVDVQVEGALRLTYCALRLP